MALLREPPLASVEKQSGWKLFKSRERVDTSELEEYRRSEERIKDRAYLNRVLEKAYDTQNPYMKAKVDSLIGGNLSDFLIALEERIGPPPPEFRLKYSEELFSKLSYEAKQPTAIEQVVRQILSHYGVNGKDIAVETEYRQTDIRKERGTLGTFSPTGYNSGVIRIVLVPDYSLYDSIIAVALHECAHALLHTRMVTLPNTDRNEILTDIAAIYMGGGAYLQRGYYAFGSFRIGYLYRMECEWVGRKVKSKREAREAAEKKELQEIRMERQSRVREMKERLENLDVRMKQIHPNHVLREKGIAMEDFQSFSVWHEHGEEVLGQVRQFARETDSRDEMKKDLLQLMEIEQRVKKWEDLVETWAIAEKHQASQAREKMDNLRGMIPLAEAGNVFAKLEFVRLWSSCKATMPDAWVYIHDFIERDDPDSLCAVGICLMEGLCSEKNEAQGKSILRKAAGLGSRDAAKILGV